MIVSALAIAAGETLLAFTEGVGSTISIYAIVKGAKSVHASKRRR